MRTATEKRLERLEKDVCDESEFAGLSSGEIRALIASKMRALFPDETALYTDAELLATITAAQRQSLSGHAASNSIASNVFAMLQGDIEPRDQSAEGQQGTIEST